jgi:site-specific DNA-methyltransferase (cytosine-N4-specific)
MAFEALPEYVGASAFRFLDQGMPPDAMRVLYERIVAGESISIEEYRQQTALAL